MPNSLNAGIHQKKDRLGKLVEVIKGATLHIRNGGAANVNSGGVLTVASGGSVSLSGSLATSGAGSIVRGTAGIFRISPVANPGTCTVGDLNVDASNRLNICTATNTWTVVGTQT